MANPSNDVEDAFLYELLFADDPVLSAIFCDEEEALEAALLDYSVQRDEDDQLDMRDDDSIDSSFPKPKGQFPRGPRQERSPYSSIYWRKYILEAQNAHPNDDQSIWNDKSFKGRQFRNRFGLPYSMFYEVCQKWNTDGEYRASTDLVNRERIDARLLILGWFRVVSKGVPFDNVEEGNDVSLERNRSFFDRFTRWFKAAYAWKIAMPRTDTEIAHVEQYYRNNLVPGAIGSIDCVHVGWDMCPTGIRSDCEGNEGYPTLAFEVVVSHTRKILACSDAFYGTWNDRTISKIDPAIKALREDDYYLTRKWTRYNHLGEAVEETGYFFICDGGYHRWECLIPPYKHQIQGTDAERWSSNMETIRKDVECTFGILKKRFMILKNKFRLHRMEDIANIFKCCCILHNMLLDWDGLDNWEEIEDAFNDMVVDDEAFTMRDHNWNGFYADPIADDDTEEEDAFHRRRAGLIEHYLYCKRHSVM